MSGDGGTLESLHGVSQHLLDKLEGVGIQSDFRPCDQDSPRDSRRLLFQLR